MNLIPKINGDVDILSDEKIDLFSLKIINSNLISHNSINIFNKNINSSKSTEIRIFNCDDNLYKIEIIDGKIFITSSKDLMYNSLTTLFNLRNDLYKNMKIIDYPKYQHREFSIDVARHFFSIDELKKIIDESSNLKINKIHLHLSDNQGWRIESKIYPLLNDIGGNDGYYTQKELNDLIKYANARYIDIIPEIDIPGHVGAILASYPELSCTKKQIDLDNGYKNNDKTLCFGDTQTLEFIKNLLNEVIEIFPSKYIHIGCDEIDLSHNKNCPTCKEYMKKNNLKSFNGVIIDFINKVANHLFENNKDVIVWNDTTRYGKLDGRIIIQNWFDYPFDKSSLREFNNNRKFIFGSTLHTYFDYPQSLLPLINTYNFRPNINNKNLYGNNILGVSSHIWTEVIDNNITLEEKIFPRLVAFSECAWSNNLDYKNFLLRLKIYLTELDSKKFSYNKNYEINNIDEIVNFFKIFLKSNGTNFSPYQMLVGSKLIFNLLKESNHIKDVPVILTKILKK